jgi:hypothetical protein
MVKTHYNRTNRVRDKVEIALKALGEPSPWPDISHWLYDNVRRWHKHAPTQGAIGGILGTDHRFCKMGEVDVSKAIGTRGRYTLWALKEWSEEE